MAKCPKCSKRKAKRYCPALAQTICPVCCADLRMIVLACPETCPYLRDARKSAADRWMPKFVQHLAAKDKQELLSVITRLDAFVMFIERAIVEVQRYQFRDLSDEEALDGLKNALKTYQTLDKGIIYEHSSESPRIQAITRAILDKVEDVNNRLQQEQHTSPIKTGDVQTCMELISERIEFEMQSAKTPQQWVRQAALYQPYPKEETQRLIVTG